MSSKWRNLIIVLHKITETSRLGDSSDDEPKTPIKAIKEEHVMIKKEPKASSVSSTRSKASRKKPSLPQIKKEIVKEEPSEEQVSLP